MSEPRTEHDPWKNVRTFDANVRGDGYIERDYGPAIGQGDDCRPRGDCAWVDEVDAARAAVDARHAEEVAAKDKQIELDHRSKVELFRENATLRDQLAAVQQERETARAIARDALACWQGEDETQDGPGKRGRSAGSRATLRQRLAALSSPSTQEPNKETKMSSEPEIARCGLCGEPMPAGEEMFNYHGYSGPCPTPAPKPPQKATCETHGHIYGHEGVCLF